MFGRTAGGLGAVLAGAALMLVACGDAVTLPVGPSATPFRSGTVGFSQTGTAPVTIDPSSIQYKLDSSSSLVVTLILTSSADTSQTVSVRASLYDPNGGLIGDATGGAVNVDPSATTAVELTGPSPLGTIASATFEVTSLPLPTSTPSATPSPSASPT